MFESTILYLRKKNKLMKQQNVVLEKSYAFGLRVVKLFMRLRNLCVERALLPQLVRSGTSVGANTEETIGAQSQADFVHKLGIAYKAARETAYWLRLLSDTEALEPKLGASFLSDIEELKRILASILKTSKAKQGSNSKFFIHNS
jgi:four helix bundle protein